VVPVRVVARGRLKLAFPLVIDNIDPVHIVVVCQAAGLRTEAYSFGYVAGWSGGDPKQVKATAERVVTCARQILDRGGLLEATAEREAA
jgi:hypothetical protein